MDKDTSFKRRLSAIVAADIAGYSRLMGQDEAATVRDLKGHQAVILPLVSRHGGRIIDTAGDGLLAEFPSVIGATACAAEVQRVMAARNEEVPEHRRMLFRIGINLGTSFTTRPGSTATASTSLHGWKGSLNLAACSSRKRSTTRCATVSTWPLRIWASAN